MPTPSQLDWADCSAVEQDPQHVNGAWVFRGTRITVAALFENLEDGVSLVEFVELFPGVSTAQARKVLEHAARSTAVAIAKRSIKWMIKALACATTLKPRQGCGIAQRTRIQPEPSAALHSLNDNYNTKPSSTQ